jgi:hypothetical protein
VSSQAKTTSAERESLDFQLEYGWKPFTLCSRHLSFREHCISRLLQADCNHWGAAVYKWEGLVKEGDHSGQTGVLIGETGDLRSRIKQYVSGTQECGNKFWRDQFLTKGEIYLYVLESAILRSKWSSFESKLVDLSGANVRLVLEQLLVSREAARGDGNRWIVNRKL